MRLKTYPSANELSAAAAGAILSFLRSNVSGACALMLSGGRTPLAAYDLVARSEVSAPGQAHVLLSDERLVPPDSVESNYRSLLPLLAALSIPEDRVLRVPTSKPIDGAAEHYHLQLKEFLGNGGRIPLGFLGLGADGHTASLFTREDIERGNGRYSVAVRRPLGPDRVSVTPELLRQVERIVFLAAGREKREMVDRLINDPLSIPAGLAVVGHSCVEAWFAGESNE